MSGMALPRIPARTIACDKDSRIGPAEDLECLDAILAFERQQLGGAGLRWKIAIDDRRVPGTHEQIEEIIEQLIRGTAKPLRRLAVADAHRVEESLFDVVFRHVRQLKFGGELAPDPGLACSRRSRDNNQQ